VKVLLVKLGALGDVLRTTPLLEGLRKKYPQCHVTWLVDPQNRAVLEHNPRIDRLESFTRENQDWKNTRYDVVINLDKEPEALEALEGMKAGLKMGFGSTRDGKVCPVNALSEYAYRLGVDDDLKFRTNQKTYQEISFEQVGLKFQKEEYEFTPDAESLTKAQSLLREKGFDPAKKSARVIGINTGSGNRFAGKKLPQESYKALAEKCHQTLGVTVFLLGGEDEKERNRWIQMNAGVPVVDTGSHSIQVFSGIVKACDLVITGDTTAMHVAIAMKVPVLAYFASTCAAEIELYGRGRKIVSNIICAPCYKRDCPIDEQCMKDMDMEKFVRSAKEILESRAAYVP